jgi:multicomponent Na+:H+ antiporter subunit D
MKSAIVPLFSWLPIAHSSAPSSISALLSGLIVKTGIYGLIMTLSIFNNKDLCNLLFVLGIVTSLVGALYGILQLDIKKILAYSTISQIGLIIIGVSAYDQAANLGALLHIFNHFLSKSLLFLCAGAIISASSERNIKHIHSVFRKSKIISLGLIVGMLAITGMPLFNGYIGKSMIKAGDYMIDARIIFHIINMGTVILFVKLLTILFRKKPEKLDEIDHLSDVLIGDLEEKPEEEVFIVDGFKKASIIYMSILTMASYFGERIIFESQFIISYMFKYSNLIESMLIYTVYIAIGVLIYKYVLFRFVKEERKYSGGFQEASAMFVIFIGVILGFVKYFV